MAAVALRGANKTYPNGFEAIGNMDLDVIDGEFLVLVGPSGCGKSTLLRMVAGLEQISGGEILIGDRVVNQLEPAERNIAMVFQNYALYPHMTVYGNMAYGLRNLGTPKAEIEARVRKAAAILELDELLERKPRLLSGGQRQRVAMGRAIVREPAVFLFDEPLSNLDAKLRVQMRLEIRKLQRDLGTTSIYVTHDQVEAMTMADRLVVMNAGVAEQVGTPMEVYRRPASRFVASFIGSPAMNFFDASATTEDRVELGDGTTLPIPPGIDVPSGMKLTAGIRPEHLAITANGSLPMQLDLAEPLGAETLLHGTLGRAKHPITVRVEGESEYTPGQALALDVEAARIHLFDGTTGARLG